MTVSSTGSQESHPSHLNSNSHSLLPKAGKHPQCKWVDCLLFLYDRCSGQGLLKKHDSVFSPVRGHCWLCKIHGHYRHPLFSPQTHWLYLSLSIISYRRHHQKQLKWQQGVNQKISHSTFFFFYSKLLSKCEVAIHRIDDLLKSWRETSFNCVCGE